MKTKQNNNWTLLQLPLLQKISTVDVSENVRMTKANEEILLRFARNLNDMFFAWRKMVFDFKINGAPVGLTQWSHEKREE